MSLATVTVTVLPLLLAQASAAFLTALVSASPDEAMSIVSATGPLAEAGALEAGLLLEPATSPQALRKRAPLRATVRAVTGSCASWVTPLSGGACWTGGAVGGWRGGGAVGGSVVVRALGAERGAAGGGRSGQRSEPAAGAGSPRGPGGRGGGTRSAMSARGCTTVVRWCIRAVSEPSKPTIPMSRPGHGPVSRRAWCTPRASTSEAQTTASPGPRAARSGAGGGDGLVEVLLGDGLGSAASGPAAAQAVAQPGATVVTDDRALGPAEVADGAVAGGDAVVDGRAGAGGAVDVDPPGERRVVPDPTEGGERDAAATPATAGRGSPWWVSVMTKASTSRRGHIAPYPSSIGALGRTRRGRRGSRGRRRGCSARRGRGRRSRCASRGCGARGRRRPRAGCAATGPSSTRW